MDYKKSFKRYCLENKTGQKARIFDEENPYIYKIFTQCALQALKAKHNRYSANGIFEYIRWFRTVEKKDNTYKMNNNYRAYYARKLMAMDNRFVDFFEIREKKEVK